jgi:hypothetical protein
LGTIRLHDLRHSCATLLFALKESRPRPCNASSGTAQSLSPRAPMSTSSNKSSTMR